MPYWRAGPDAAPQVAAAMKGLFAARSTSEIEYRVILHHGPVALGGAASLGEESLMGPEVNFAFRMEKVAAVQNVAFCLSAAAHQILSGRLRLAPIPGEHELKGFPTRHRFFSLEG